MRPQLATHIERRVDDFVAFHRNDGNIPYLFGLHITYGPERSANFTLLM